MLRSLLYWTRRRLAVVQRGLAAVSATGRPIGLPRYLRVAEGLFLAGIALVSVRLAALFSADVSEIVSTDPGFRMQLDLTDALQLYIFLFGVWEPSTTALVKKLVDPGSVVVDVGAHAGYYSLLASSLQAEVLAFEPDSEMAGRLKANAEMNDSQIDVRRTAVASDAKGRVLHRGPRHNRGLSSTTARWNLSEAGPVDSARLVDLVEPSQLQRVSLLKIDVEGAEPDVLAGMRDMWSRLPPNAVVLLEVSPRWWGEAVVISDLLAPARESGFRVWTIENSYSPLRYLTPSRQHVPVVEEGELSSDVRRYDLVLARRQVWE